MPGACTSFRCDSCRPATRSPVRLLGSDLRTRDSQAESMGSQNQTPKLDFKVQLLSLCLERDVREYGRQNGLTQGQYYTSTNGLSGPENRGYLEGV